MNSEKNAASVPLPLMKDFDEAEALARQQNDPFYLAAFLLQCWLGGLLQRAAAEYADKKHPKERLLQAGESWRSFLELFAPSPENSCLYLLGCMFRFSAADNSPGNSLRRALVPLTIEHRLTGRYFGPQTMAAFQARGGDGSSPLPAPHPLESTRDAKRRKAKALKSQKPSSPPAAPSGSTCNLQPAPCNPPPVPLPQPSTLSQLARPTLIRWCDWLDAAIHQRTHRLWHLAPACFDPDPEIRELAALGEAQRHLAHLDPRAQACWALDFASAAARYKNSPKWTALGNAMSADSGRPWTYAEVDILIIALWPLVKQYNWTYVDLLKTIRPALKRPNAYPCEREQDFATYCSNVLGLSKKGRGRSAKAGRPEGYDIARELCPALKKAE